MNKNFIERGKLLIERNMLQMDTLKPVAFSLPFDWNCSFDIGDMFLYRVQTFKFLLYICDYHEDKGNIKALELACDILEDWLEHFSQTAPQGMEKRFASSLASNIYVWHDHATALRAENWLLFMDYCQEKVPDFWTGKQNLKAQMTKALARHGSILAEDAFYSARCNHGIEQARVLLRLAEEPSLAPWPEADQPSWRTIAITRLADEFNTCFTHEGVHKENSPGYHVFVFKILLNILADPHLKAVHEILNAKFNLMARQALEYIAQILQPNKCLPIIGDTEHLPVTDGFRAALGTTKEYAHYLYAATAGQKGCMPTIVNKVYPEAGWAIFRNSWNKATYQDMLHLVCKAGCLVRYHHQLDEGQFVLFARGEHWFIDSGFFDYNRSSDIFKYIRSRKAHNVPNVFGAKLKDFDERVQSWHMDSWSETTGNAHVSMINSIYENVTLKRRIDYPGEFNLTLTDNVECNDKTPRDVQFLFHIPKDKQITVEGDLIRIESSKNICTLKIETPEPFTVQVSKGKTSEGTIRSQVSWQVKKCEDSRIILISFNNIQTLKVSCHINICSKATQPVKSPQQPETQQALELQNSPQTVLQKNEGAPAALPQSSARELICGTRCITWYLKKAQIPNAPILVVLHGQGYNAQPAKFTSPNWNVVCPMDNFGWEKAGSWFLGENGDFFWLEAISNIIDQVRSECGAGRLYFWGSSMGGYGALLHGYLHNAYAVYASVPQTHFYGTAYGLANKKYFDPIFNGKEYIYNNLVDIITTRHRTLYFMAFSGLEAGNYILEQCLPLISQFSRIKQRYYLEIYPTRKHQRHHTLAQSLEVLKRVITLE